MAFNNHNIRKIIFEKLGYINYCNTFDRAYRKRVEECINKTSQFYTKEYHQKMIDSSVLFNQDCKILNKNFFKKADVYSIPNDFYKRMKTMCVNKKFRTKMYFRIKKPLKYVYFKYGTKSHLDGLGSIYDWLLFMYEASIDQLQSSINFYVNCNISSESYGKIIVSQANTFDLLCFKKIQYNNINELMTDIDTWSNLTPNDVERECDFQRCFFKCVCSDDNNRDMILYNANLDDRVDIKDDIIIKRIGDNITYRKLLELYESEQDKYESINKNWEESLHILCELHRCIIYENDDLNSFSSWYSTKYRKRGSGCDFNCYNLEFILDVMEFVEKND